MKSHKNKIHLIYISNHGIISLCLLFFFTIPAESQPGPDQQSQYANFSPSMAIIIVILIAALFFMAFFSIYIRHCTDAAGGAASIRPILSMRSRAARGLDPSVIETFPTFEYAVVKDRKIGKGALECAVCLNEFEDDETLRLLPRCDHVFHPECIDAWLSSHVTCPVCRADLAPQPGDPTDSVNELHPESNIENNTMDQSEICPNGEFSVRVGDEQESVPVPSSPEMVNRNSSMNKNRPQRSWSLKPRLFARFRSHSTGHSLVQPGVNLDRYTLRLPEEVRKEVITHALLNRTASFAVASPREGSSRRTAEGSSRGSRPYRRLEKLDRDVKSDRWVLPRTTSFFSRSSSMKSPKVVTDYGEGSTSSRTPRGLMTAVKAPFKFLEQKRDDETGLVGAESGKSPL